MDGHLAIDHNRQALTRIVATLMSMAGLRNGRTTLPRHLRNAVTRLLRPAEAATRRLAIALALGFVVTLPALRARASTGMIAPRSMAAPATRKPLRPFSLRLLDPLRQPFARRRVYVPAHRLPRIWTLGMNDPAPLPPLPSPHDELDARRVRLRLDALASALDDLPKQAWRFARWQARQRPFRKEIAEGGQAETSLRDHRTAVRPALRLGRPPGSRCRKRQEVHEILAHAHRLARWALDNPDSS